MTYMLSPANGQTYVSCDVCAKIVETHTHPGVPEDWTIEDYICACGCGSEGDYHICGTCSEAENDS